MAKTKVPSLIDLPPLNSLLATHVFPDFGGDGSQKMAVAPALSEGDEGGRKEVKRMELMGLATGDRRKHRLTKKSDTHDPSVRVMGN